MNHLVLQLIYERHLREKYEEDANRLYFIKIEKDQLVKEKNYTEQNLKQLVEKYKMEVEESLRSQNNLELNAYREDVKEKSELIVELQAKLDANNIEIQDLRQKFEELKLDHKKVEKEYGEVVQTFDKEENIKTKYEIDYQYMNALKYTVTETKKRQLSWDL